jgi:hypothetical protein
MASPTFNPSAYRYPPVLSPNRIKQGRLGGQSVNRQAPVRFSGAGDALSSLISVIDSKRVVELVTSDFAGMLLPRGLVAAIFRGNDDARETVNREAFGLFCVALLSGLTNQLMVQALGNRVGFYNPHGIPAKAWISAKNLRVYGELYKQALQAPGVHSIQDGRTTFLERIFDGLESGDKKLSLNGRLMTLKSLAKKESVGASVRQALAQMTRDAHGAAATDALQQDYWNYFQAGRMDTLREEFLKAGWGKLSAEGKKQLFDAFRQTEPGGAAEGLVSIDRMAWNRVNELQPKATGIARQKEFLKQRMLVSLKNLRDQTPDFIKRVDQVALNHGLTSLVDLKATAAPGAETLTSGQSRQTILKEVKAFLDHYVDRAGFEVSESLKTKKDTALSMSDWGAQKEMLYTRLFAPSAKGLGRLLPQAEDGLVTATLKAKTAYTVVPILVAIIANGITTFMNNYITQKKYHGRVFFPGEETYINRQQASSAKPSVMQAGRWA